MVRVHTRRRRVRCGLSLLKAPLLGSTPSQYRNRPCVPRDRYDIRATSVSEAVDICFVRLCAIFEISGAATERADLT